MEVGRCVILSAPGPHVFLLVLQPGRLTLEQWAALDWLSAVFAPQALKHTLLILTWADQLGGKPAENFTYRHVHRAILCNISGIC